MNEPQHSRRANIEALLGKINTISSEYEALLLAMTKEIAVLEFVSTKEISEAVNADSTEQTVNLLNRWNPLLLGLEDEKKTLARYLGDALRFANSINAFKLAVEDAEKKVKTKIEVIQSLKPRLETMNTNN